MTKRVDVRALTCGARASGGPVKLCLDEIARVAMLGIAIPLFVTAVSGCGVGFATRHRTNDVRPSADELAAEQRLLTQPFALALPEDAIVRVVGPSMTCTG